MMLMQLTLLHGLASKFKLIAPALPLAPVTRSQWQSSVCRLCTALSVRERLARVTDCSHALGLVRREAARPAHAAHASTSAARTHAADAADAADLALSTQQMLACVAHSYLSSLRLTGKLHRMRPLIHLSTAHDQ